MKSVNGGVCVGAKEITLSVKLGGDSPRGWGNRSTDHVYTHWSSMLDYPATHTPRTWGLEYYFVVS